MLLERRFPKRQYGRRSITATRRTAYYHEQLALRKEHDPVTSLTNELYAIFMCHLMAGSQEAVKYTKLLLEDVKKAPKSEGLHILWMHMMPFLQEPVKDILITVTRFISVPVTLWQTDFRRHIMKIRMSPWQKRW